MHLCAEWVVTIFTSMIDVSISVLLLLQGVEQVLFVLS